MVTTADMVRMVEILTVKAMLIAAPAAAISITTRMCGTVPTIVSIVVPAMNEWKEWAGCCHASRMAARFEGEGLLMVLLFAVHRFEKA